MESAPGKRRVYDLTAWFAFQAQKGDRNIIDMILTEKYTIVSKEKIIYN